MLEKLKECISTAEGKLCGLVLQDAELILEYNINRNLLSEQAMVYIGVAEKMLEKGIKVYDEVSIGTTIESMGGIIERYYHEFGGYNTVREMISVVNTQNAESIIDEWNKFNLVKRYHDKGILDLKKHWVKIVHMSSGELVNYIEYLISDDEINVCTDIKFEKLSYTDEELLRLQKQLDRGLSYAKHSYQLDYLTTGIAKANVYLFGGYTNSGKSSYIFENMICDIVEQGIKCCVISNEQKADAFKLLLQIHVLTHRLNYKKLTRKKIKTGNFTSAEDMMMMRKAKEIIEKEYNPYLEFVKLFDYNTQQVNKIIKKMSKVGCECFFYDTFKVSESGDGQTWEKLLRDSKDLFQIASKNNVALIMSVQLALHSKNKTRWLDEGILSNGKQMAETIETGVYMRDIWADEFAGETYDIKPYIYIRDTDGNLTKEKEYIKLDREKRYKLFFLSKCRSDENGQVLVYEYEGDYNHWKEIARCTPYTKNMY